MSLPSNTSPGYRQIVFRSVKKQTKNKIRNFFFEIWHFFIFFFCHRTRVENNRSGKKLIFDKLEINRIRTPAINISSTSTRWTGYRVPGGCEGVNHCSYCIRRIFFEVTINQGFRRKTKKKKSLGSY